MRESEFLSKTGTLGPTIESREFTDDEKVVLTHFFTNIDRNVYAATDAMPNSLWALLEGGYSRSQVSMRMRFLGIFEEMEAERAAGKLSESEVVSVKQFADNIRSGQSLNLSFFLRRAEQFMRKWAVQYGHDSLKDSDVVRFAIENISQFAVPAVQEARLGAYQEKSTRYVNFSADSLVVPPEFAEFEGEMREWNNFLLSNYEESKEIVRAFIESRLDRSSFKSEEAFNRTVSAKVFDIVRYFLPSTILTSLGVVWPTREAERHIARLLSDHSEEIRKIGEALLEEGKKVSPGLLSHVVVSDYQRSRFDSMRAVHGLIKAEPPVCVAGRCDDAVRLLSVSPDIEAHIAAAVLFEHSRGGHSYSEYLKLCKSNKAVVESVIDDYLKSRGKFDSLPMPAEVGHLLFEVIVDFGAYRDIKRHRRNLFLAAPFTALIGFEYPEYVERTPELADIKRRIEVCAARTTELHEKVCSKYPHLAGYVVMFAHKQRMLWQMDPRQLAYVVELRTAPAGHHSYRTICQELYRLAAPHLPVLSRHIRVDFSSSDEGRKKQEERTVEKLRALGADPTKVS